MRVLHGYLKSWGREGWGGEGGAEVSTHRRTKGGRLLNLRDILITDKADETAKRTKQPHTYITTHTGCALNRISSIPGIAGSLL